MDIKPKDIPSRVRMIVCRAMQNKKNVKWLAEEYNISPALIYNICGGWLPKQIRTIDSVTKMIEKELSEI